MTLYVHGTVGGGAPNVGEPPDGPLPQDERDNDTPAIAQKTTQDLNQLDFILISSRDSDERHGKDNSQGTPRPSEPASAAQHEHFPLSVAVARPRPGKHARGFYQKSSTNAKRRSLTIVVACKTEWAGILDT